MGRSTDRESRILPSWPPRRGLHEMASKDWSGGPAGQELPRPCGVGELGGFLTGDAKPERLRVIDRRHGLLALKRASAAAEGYGGQASPWRSQGRGDATGTRSGSPCQDVLYYSTHLAVADKPSHVDGDHILIRFLSAFPPTFWEPQRFCLHQHLLAGRPNVIPK